MKHTSALFFIPYPLHPIPYTFQPFLHCQLSLIHCQLQIVHCQFVTAPYTPGNAYVPVRNTAFV